MTNAMTTAPATCALTAQTLPLEGGGQGGGEIVERRVGKLSAPMPKTEAHLTLPPTPSPPGRGR